ncbi:unnamed protein product, partial [marine sediment metagenome]
MATIRIPNNWEPRPYQLEALKAFDEGKRRQSLIWHRRAGKDSFSLNLTAREMQLNVGTYWHLFPLQTQARKAIWSGIGADGRKFLEQAFPKELRAATRSQEMQIELKNGSLWQMAGSDQYDSLVGSNVKGVVFSEWALADPRAWDYIRPIIRENDGWAVFITTYRGRNHAYRMHKKVGKLDTWHTATYDITQTTKANGEPVLTEADMQAERDEGMSEEMIQQEYYCDPMAAFEGSYFGLAMRKMVKEGRIGRVGYETDLPVVAAFDLGMDDEMSAIFLQEHRSEVRIIGSRSWRRTSIPDVCHDLNNLPYHINHLYLPHDA